MRLINFFLVVFILCFSGLCPSYALPSFPGAEGFGADNPGGRGYPVFKVTSISGFSVVPGSFGYALSQANSAGGGYIEVYINELSDYIVAGQEPPWINTNVETKKALIPSLLKFASAHPFTSGIMLGYWVPSSTKNDKKNVRFDIFSVNGKLVKNLILASKKGGNYTIQWRGLDNNGKRVNNGVYICRAVIGDKGVSKKLIMIK